MALTDNLVSYWKLDESSGNAADSVGSNTLTNTSVSYVTGKIGNAAQFGSGKKLTSPNDTSLNTSNFTLSAWVYFTGTNSQQSRIAERDDVSTERLWIATTGESNTTFDFYAWNSTGTLFSANGGGTNLSQNAWHHVVATWDGSYIKRYVDGSAYGTDLSVSGSLKGATEPLTIGNDTYGINRYLAGNIDEVGIWSRALTSTEVTELYNGGAGLQYPFTTNKPSLFPFFSNYI